ncbi:MAG: hypothetical protein FJY29_13090 [Betaproteobacteria bacterium]|nr:hypothetical protein [Betaproteobacteria bacterium]
MKTILCFGIMLLAAGCRSGSTEGDADAQAVKRYQKDGEFIIEAQKADDIKIMSAGWSPKYRDANGNEKTLRFYRGYLYISVRQALGDGILAWASGNVIRDVFVMSEGSKEASTVKTAMRDDWQVTKIVTDPQNYLTASGVKVFCPLRIEYKKKDGKPYVSNFSDINCRDILLQ